MSSRTPNSLLAPPPPPPPPPQSKATNNADIAKGVCSLIKDNALVWTAKDIEHVRVLILSCSRGPSKETLML